ncbi:HTH domain-containing protein [Candidatus Nitrosocosmicus agrestis]|jgi:predicted transcriptional regulator|uniref:HTH domain-containing protein n=1 Tax=Candidatus Nitrosocosmicus agrestis TaxID=2563600 RepID=UPI00122E0F21|nr:HTH domain-containing protein [Candidatus Nitrosocosmicus sp. SS]KAA2282969.1 HTH domain-containing protein [Candidatus Nitrosocosmicus sp. SS]KAF0869172.1 HTH domain-containing protein [Candidatus Nitrosocosmicus sp. SS]
MSANNNTNNKLIVERREKVMVLVTKGLKGYQIAQQLNIDPSTVSRDIQYLSKESNNALNSLAKETLPFMYQSSIEGIRSILKESWKIYNNEEKDLELTWSHRLKALEITKSCYESMFKLVSEGPSLVYMKALEERVEKISSAFANEDENR